MRIPCQVNVHASSKTGTLQLFVSLALCVDLELVLSTCRMRAKIEYQLIEVYEAFDEMNLF